jgi:hypothetical protein
MSSPRHKMQINAITPPLLPEERETIGTQYSGHWCESIIESYFTSKQIKVARPTIDDGIDFMIKKPEGWRSAQVKKIVIRTTRELDYFRCYFQGRFKSSYTKKCKGDTDYFYHVLATPYRQLIFETPESLVPTNKEGVYAQGVSPALTRSYHLRRIPRLHMQNQLVSALYAPEVVLANTLFFT